MKRSTREILVWDEVRPVLERRLRASVRELTTATDVRHIGVVQGRIEVLEEMLDLPVALEQILEDVPLEADVMAAEQAATRMTLLGPRAR